MKNKFNYLFKALFIFISLLFLGCETQEEVIKSTSNFKKYQINFDEFNIDKNAKSALDQIKEEQIQNRQAKSGDAQQRIMYNKEFDFYIDTDKIVVVENSNYRQYTFPIYRTSENVKLENLVIKSKNNEPFKAYTIKYTLTALEKEIISNGGYVDVSDDTEISTLSKFAQLEDGTCWETITVTSQATGWDDETWQQVDCPGSLGGGGGSGYIPNFNTGNGGIGSFPTGDTSGNGGGHQTSGGGSSNINYIVATPTISLEQSQIKNFMNSLTDEQHDFLYPDIDLNNLSENDNTTADSVIEYLNENDFSEESQEFVSQIINSGLNQTLITAKPFYKYPLGSNYATLYPNFTSLLTDYLPYMTNPTMVNIIHSITGVSNEQIINDLKWGSGAEIQIVQLGVDPVHGEIKGKFDPNNPNVIQIDVDLVNLYESSYDPTNEATPLQSLILFSVLLHELVHYEDYQFDNIMINNIELGEYFEELFLGGFYEFNSNGDGTIVFIKP